MALSGYTPPKDGARAAATLLLTERRVPPESSGEVFVRCKPAFQQLTFAVALLVTLGGVMVAEALADPQTAPAAAADTPAPLQAGPLQIIGLCNAAGQEIDRRPGGGVGLNDTLWVVVGLSQQGTSPDVAALCKAAAGPTPAQKASAPASEGTVPAAALDPNAYTLFLNGLPLEGLTDTMLGGQRNALGFRLSRNGANRQEWARLLGSATALHRTVAVSLGEKSAAGTIQPTIFGSGTSSTFELEILSAWRFAIASAVSLILLVVTFRHVRTSTTLRDNLLPQLEPRKQTYSLGRCQMAFWFVLVFVSFVFLYFLLWDYNTVSEQALALMGIASATALASVAVDIKKDSPADFANRALQALGFGSYADVVRMEAELKLREPLISGAQRTLDVKKQAAALARSHAEQNPQDAALQGQVTAALQEVDRAAKDLQQLQIEIQDRKNALRTYREKSEPFASQGWFKDLTTDLNGPTLHRVQVVFWTLALGVVFLVGVYRDLAMPPDFSGTLLALMGLSGAGYVGFKFPEKND